MEDDAFWIGWLVDLLAIFWLFWICLYLAIAFIFFGFHPLGHNNQQCDTMTGKNDQPLTR